jgi:aminoglycoside 2''-phosphotransferase
MRSDAKEAVAHHFASFLGDPAMRLVRPILVHGDLGSGNLLYDPVSERLSGVLDWGCAGPDDPAVDYAAAATLSTGFLERLVAVSAEAAAVARRVAFYSGTFALQEALFGIENGDEAALEAGLEDYR